MTQAIILSRVGGPEVMRLQHITLADPAAGEVRIRHTAIGVNFVDTYYRSGLYPVALPSGLGNEAAGIVEAVGQGVQQFKIGDRVAYGTGPLGAYASARNINARHLIKLPDTISADSAAAMMLKGMTVRYLLQETWRVKPGDTILWHAAAGGVGLIAVQWAKALGAIIIGTVGSASKAELLKAYGCDHIIDTSVEDTVERVKDITGGQGVPVVYDGIGKASFLTSLACLQPRGLLVSFGNASGAVDAFNLGVLAQKGSLYVTRPTLATYTATEAELQANAQDVIAMVETGRVKIPINQTYNLDEITSVHRDLENRKTTGATVLHVKDNVRGELESP